MPGRSSIPRPAAAASATTSPDCWKASPKVTRRSPHSSGANVERAALDPAVVARIDVDVLGRPAIRRAVGPGTWYLATSLFLHPISLDPIPASVTEAGLPVAALLYDVIPYRYPEQYLTEDDPLRQARLRAVLSRTVDVFGTNCEFVSRTAVEVLGLDPARLHVTGCGVAARFRPGDRAAARSVARPYLAGAHQSIVAAITGGDDRKNTDGLLNAWALLPRATRIARTLVVIAGASDDVLRRWIRSAAELGITGEVRFAVDADDDQVVAMLQAAELVVVPSLEEGFGLPVLEGAACGAPVVCSGVSSLPEVLPEPRAHFDPNDASDMARVIDRALTDEALRAVLTSAAGDALERWTWRRVARDVVSAMASTTPLRRTRSPRRRYAVLAEDLAAAAPMVAEIRARAPDAEVTIGLDPVGPATRVPFVDGTFLATALGRYIKPNDLDGIVAVVDEDTASTTLAPLAASHGAAVAARSDDPPPHSVSGRLVADG